MNTTKKIIGLILAIILMVVFIGSVYFTVYDTTHASLADASYLLTFIFGLIFIIYSRETIGRSFKMSFSSPDNGKKTFWGFFILVLGAGVINAVSKYVGGTTGFTLGLALGAVLIIIYFAIFNSWTKK